MKQRFNKAWILGIGLFALAGAASAQTAGSASAQNRQKVVTQKEAAQGETKKNAKSEGRTIAQVEADIKALKQKMDAEKLKAGYQALPYEEKLEKLENELKILKHQPLEGAKK